MTESTQTDQQPTCGGFAVCSSRGSEMCAESDSYLVFSHCVLCFHSPAEHLCNLPSPSIQQTCWKNYFSNPCSTLSSTCWPSLMDTYLRLNFGPYTPEAHRKRRRHHNLAKDGYRHSPFSAHITSCCHRGEVVEPTPGIEPQRGAISSMPALWLVPQVSLAGLAEAFMVNGQVEFYYEQFLENTRSIVWFFFFCGMWRHQAIWVVSWCR